MTDKQGLASSQVWMAAGIGSALLAGHIMLDTASRFHRAGRPARLLLGAAPFAMAGWMLSQMAARTPRVASEPAPAARRKRVVEASDAEVVAAPKPRLVSPAAPVVTPEPVPEVTEPVEDASVPAVEAVAESVVVEATPEPVTESVVVEATPEPALAFVADRPTALAAPRDAGADDLTRIKGIGPKLAAQLNDLGYYHFDQVAAWGDAELALVDAALDGVPGRPTRNDWIGQAALLARPGVH